MEEEQLNIEFEPKQPSHGKRVYVYFAILAIVVLSIFFAKAKWQNHVMVTQVSVEGTNILSKEEIVRLMKLPPRVSMYDIDLTALQRNIQSNAFVKNVIVKRDAPSQLLAIIEERTPAAMLTGSELFYIDEEGVVLPYIASSEGYDIPIISGADSNSQIKAGRKILNSDIQEALEIIRIAKAASPEIYHAISEIRLRKGHDIVCYTFESGAPVIFGKGDIAQKVVKLDAFWQKFMRNSDPRDIQYIDIRFDDQVVVSRKNS
ncbi:MAG: FtsQ-type POTRA domain-containing protein [Ignavibacteriales bacterium]|nr:FtsQ-type POTRA domain-containing protein [Ignavibacteriales bacterium]